MQIQDYHALKAMLVKYSVDESRISMGQATFEKDPVVWHEVSQAWLVGRNTWVRIVPAVVSASCNCQDYRRNSDAGIHVLCRHLVAVIYQLMEEEGVSTGFVPVNPPEAKPEKVATFSERVTAAVGKAILQISRTVGVAIDSGVIPLLLGPSGCGKTSGIEMVANERDWGLEVVAGSPSFADSDLVGLDLGTRKSPGVFARAFARAREGETMLICLDELLRFNERALDILMTPMLPISQATANRQNIPATGSIYKVEAPIWGIEWAPVENIRLAAATNPWGANIDAALMSRFEPMTVRMEDSIADMFDGNFASAIRVSWKNVDEGIFPLGLEYRALQRANSPTDTQMFAQYLTRLHYLDRAAAESFDMTLKGMGIRVNRQ